MNLDPLDGPLLTIVRGRESEQILIDPRANLHLPCIEDFVSAIRPKHSQICSGNDKIATNQLLADILA